MEQPKLTLLLVERAPLATNIQLDKNPDLIWSMWHDDHMRLYFDCGDAGFVALTPEQAAAVLIEVSKFIGSRV